MSKSADQEKYRELLEEIACEYCEPGRYCIFKEFLISAHTSRRLLFQLKAVDKFKFEKGKELDREVDWQEAMTLWVSEGYAEKFGNLYNENIKFNVLYKKVRSGDEEKK